MQHEFWQSRWAEGQIGFHENRVNPVLLRHGARVGIATTDMNDQVRVLVPLCGKSLDLSWFEDRGCSVLGVEFVEQAAFDYFKLRGPAPQRLEVAGQAAFSDGRVQIVVGDFFATTVRAFGQVDVIYDRAALVAIAPERRHEYVERLAAWLKPGGCLLLVVFEHDMGSGPPFSVPEAEALLAAHFEFELLEDEDILDAEPRFRDRGATRFRQRVYLAKNTRA